MKISKIFKDIKSISLEIKSKLINFRFQNHILIIDIYYIHKFYII